LPSRFAKSKVSTQGRRFAAKIAVAEEQTSTFTSPDTGEEITSTQLMLRLERGDGKYELEWYRIPDDPDAPITIRSDLGKLIDYFSKMRIPDIGEDNYEPIKDLHVWIQVFPRTNRRTGEPSDKRFPVALMKPDEIATEFGARAKAQATASAPVDEGALFGSIKDDVVATIDGLPQKGLYTKLASIKSVAEHAQATTIFELAQTGKLLDWLKSESLVSVDESGVIHVLSAAEAESDAKADVTPDAAVESE
jgi:hypothetical protein